MLRPFVLLVTRSVTLLVAQRLSTWQCRLECCDICSTPFRVSHLLQTCAQRMPHLAKRGLNSTTGRWPSRDCTTRITLSRPAKQSTIYVSYRHTSRGRTAKCHSCGIHRHILKLRQADRSLLTRVAFLSQHTAAMKNTLQNACIIMHSPTPYPAQLLQNKAHSAGRAPPGQPARHPRPPAPGRLRLQSGKPRPGPTGSLAWTLRQCRGTAAPAHELQIHNKHRSKVKKVHMTVCALSRSLDSWQAHFNSPP